MKWLILQILPPDLYFAFTWPHVAQKFGYSNFFEHDTLGYQKKNILAFVLNLPSTAIFYDKPTTLYHLIFLLFFIYF